MKKKKSILPAPFQWLIYKQDTLEERNGILFYLTRDMAVKQSALETGTFKNSHIKHFLFSFDAGVTLKIYKQLKIYYKKPYK